MASCARGELVDDKAMDVLLRAAAVGQPGFLAVTTHWASSDELSTLVTMHDPAITYMIPRNTNGNHWILITIRDNVVEARNSLRHYAREAVQLDLDDILAVVARQRGHDVATFRVTHIDAAQQRNSVDCGMFTLNFAVDVMGLPHSRCFTRKNMATLLRAQLEAEAAVFEPHVETETES